MSGRKEKDYMINQKNELFLKDKPSYLQDFSLTLLNKTVTSRENYLKKVWRFLSYVEKKHGININNIDEICTIKPSIIEGYIGSLKIKNTSKASMYYAIKSFFDFLVDDDFILKNPCEKIQPPRDNEIHEIVYLTKEEIAMIKENYNKQMEKAPSFEKNYGGKEIF